MRYEIGIGLVLCAAGALWFFLQGSAASGHSTTPASPKHRVRAQRAGDVVADAAPEAPAQRLLATDRELIEPEMKVEEGELSSAAGAPVARFALRIVKRTLQLSEPLEASVSVTDNGKAHPFRVVSKDVLRSEGGISEPGGSWSEQPTTDGAQLTWLPGDLPAPTGERELVVAIEVDGETHLLSARFAVGGGSPITLTGRVTEHRRTGVLEIDVEADSKRAYACELSANLFDTIGTPLQHTTWTGRIGPGTSHASLQFSQDIQADTHTLTAPIVVRQFRGSCRPSDAPDEPALAVPLLEELYRTPS